MARVGVSSLVDSDFLRVRSCFLMGQEMWAGNEGEGRRDRGGLREGTCQAREGGVRTSCLSGHFCSSGLRKVWMWEVYPEAMSEG